MEKVIHTKGPFKVQGGSIVKPGAERTSIAGVTMHGTGCSRGYDPEDLGNASLIGSFDQVPHDCGDPACPGNRNRRRLELFPQIRAAMVNLVCNWEKGDLASAVRRCGDLLSTMIEEDL